MPRAVEIGQREVRSLAVEQCTTTLCPLGPDRDQPCRFVDSDRTVEEFCHGTQIDRAVRLERRAVGDDHAPLITAQALRLERPADQVVECVGCDDGWRFEHGNVGSIHAEKLDDHQECLVLLMTCHARLARRVTRELGRYGAPVNDPTDPSAPLRSERSVIAFLAFVGILMAFGIDGALPAFDELRSDFDLDARDISPAVTGTVYFAGMALGQLLCGVLADRFGRRPVLVGGLAIYALGAVASALSPTFGVLLGSRFVWGLGASAPSVLRFAIARDLFSGDRMARVVSTFMAFFLIGPIIAPFVGEGVLLIGSWRTVFALGVVLAVLAAVWAVRFGETLAPELRRPIRIAPFADAFRAVIRTRVTLWCLIGSTLFNGSFFVWLGSAQPVIDEVYDRDSQFTLFFGLSGVGMAIALLVNNRLIDRFGTFAMIRRAGAAHVVVSCVALAVTLLANGVPSVWLWFAWALVANAMSMIVGPMSSAAAMAPMADKAGTASAILGLGQLGIGALLGAFIDAQIDTTVTPMVAGAVVFGGLGWLAFLRATNDTSVVDPVRQRS